MAEPKIPGGYILLSRRIIESKIWDKPPLYIKVWIYLLSKAQHKKYKLLEKGQLITNIPEIRKACSWLVGYRREYPSKDNIYQIIDWLRNPDEAHNESNTRATMIATTKATQQLLINICNYSFYQDSENYESNSEGSNEKATNAQRKQRQPNNINKNDKNDKNNKNEIYNSFTPPTIEEVQIYCKERNNNVDAEKWYDFYLSKGWMIGKNKMRDWKAAIRTWEKPSKTQEKPSKTDVMQQAYEELKAEEEQ
jgi:hypothetical protein